MAEIFVMEHWSYVISQFSFPTVGAYTTSAPTLAYKKHERYLFIDAFMLNSI